MLNNSSLSHSPRVTLYKADYMPDMRLKSVINSLVYYFTIIDLKHFPILNLSLVNIHICDFYSFCSRFAPELSYIFSFVDKFHCSLAKDGSVTTAFQLPLNPINYLLFPDRCGTEKAI